MLPSEVSARMLLERGFVAAAPGILRNLAERTSLVAIGLRLAGIRQPWRPALFGALVVEAAVILWVRRDRSPMSHRPTIPKSAP